jgi:putative spermidine/putrescine transport system permease protein
MTTLAAVTVKSDAVPADDGPIVTADGTPLAQKLAQVTRRAKMRAFLFVLPLLLFVILLFVVPIGQMLLLSVSEPTFSSDMPRTSRALATWDHKSLPGEPTFKALLDDLKDLRERQAAGKVGSAVNHVYSGARSVIVSTARNADSFQAPLAQAVIDHNETWKDPVLWATLASLSRNPTSLYYLNAVDRTLDAEGRAVSVPENQRIHVWIFWRTFWLSALITLICFALGYPVAYLLAHLPLKTSNLLMICVLLPFWTALLVRITAWIALLQNNGVVLEAAAALGMVDAKERPQLVYNMTGTIVAMVHVLLPSMILPLYSVMKTIPPSYVRAARSLGATSFTAFWRVYYPQTLPGIAAGGLLVFILSVGYYITPALLGGKDGILISNFIALHMEQTLNWSLAAALGGLLLAATLILYWLFNKLVGIDRLKMG